MKDRRKVYTFILSEALKDEKLPDFTVVHTIQSKVRNLHCNIYIAGQRLHAYGTIWGYEALFEELLNALSMQTWSAATTQTHLEIIPIVYGMQDHGIELRQLKPIAWDVMRITGNHYSHSLIHSQGMSGSLWYSALITLRCPWETQQSPFPLPFIFHSQTPNYNSIPQNCILIGVHWHPLI